MASYDKQPWYKIITETDYLFFYRAKKGHNYIDFANPGYKARLFVNACDSLNPFNCTFPSMENH